jgi:hypothetical protein
MHIAFVNIPGSFKPVSLAFDPVKIQNTVQKSVTLHMKGGNTNGISLIRISAATGSSAAVDISWACHRYKI